MCPYHRISVRRKTKKRCGQGAFAEEIKKTCGNGWGYQGALLKYVGKEPVSY